ncbi:MAG: GldG family protein [Mariprofundaceae bacterium]|nr:GldG family protein [Mariprofundaceae bacterium]
MSGTDRRKRLRRKAWVALLTVLLAAAAMTMAASALHLRWDMTENGMYTLSDSTRSVLDKLDEPVMIRAYITKDLPQPYGQLRRFVADMLRSYHEAGHGKAGFEIVDPASDPNIAASLTALNIPKVQVQVVENDQAQVKQGYMAVVVEYLDKKETIPIVRGEQGFEYLLTRKIKKLTGKGRIKIGVVDGFGARGISQLQALKQQVSDDYELVTVEPDKKPVGKDLKAVIVAGFNQPPSGAERYALDQFRMSGRGILILAGNVEPQLRQGFQVKSVDAKANAWLNDFGIAVGSGLVMDPRAARVNVNQRRGIFTFRSVVDYPFVPEVEGMDKTNPITGRLQAVSVPFASPLEWFGDGPHGDVLLASSAMASVQAGPPFDVDPLVPMRKRFDGLTRRQVNLAMVEQGVAKSAFSSPPQGVSSTVKHMASTKHSRVVVVGSRALLDDQFMSGGNLIFVLNTLDWLAGDEALIELRSRGVIQRPLAALTRGGRSMYKGLWIFGLPLLVVVIGLWRWRRLRSLEASL